MVTQEIQGFVDLRPGDIGFGPIQGRTGRLIRIAQAIVDGGAPYQHVFVVVTAADIEYSQGRAEGSLVGPYAVEAMPGGAIRTNIRNRWTKEFCYIRPDYANEEQALQVARMATKLVGTPYSYLDYLALALHHLHLPSRRTDAYIRSSKHMICSQLVDYCLCVAGWHAFDDGRLSQDVIPSAFYNALVRKRPLLQTVYPR